MNLLDSALELIYEDLEKVEVRSPRSGLDCCGENHGQVCIVRVRAFGDHALLLSVRRASREY